MKKIVAYIFLILLVGTYLVSTMGIGIHECTKKGTKDVIVLFGGDPCKLAHAATKKVEESKCCCCCCSGGGDGQSSLHSSKCCDTKVYVISYEQVVSQQLSVDVPPVSDISLLLPNDEDCSLLANSSSFSGVAYPSGFVKAKPPCDLIVSNAQFRI